jgi:hypothetical protein
MPKRQTVTLANGSTCVVRALSLFDFQELGRIPGVLALTRSRAKAAPAAEPTAADMEYGTALTRIMLTRCVGAITSADGKTKVRITDKPFDECDERAEVSPDELAPADVTALVDAVKSLSGMTEEAATAAIPFPSEPEVAGDAAHAGQDLRTAAA